MGWSFEVCERSKKDFVESLTGDKHFSEDYKALEHRVVGNHVWQLVRQVSANRVFICLDLIAKERNGGWGYKGLSEDMGPYHYDCPLSLLEKASEPINESAAEWRQKVRSHHAAKKARPIPKEGLIVKYGSHEYRFLHRQANSRKGWAVERVSDGARYRLGLTHIAKSTLVEAV